MTDRAHEVGIIAGNEIKGAQVNRHVMVGVGFRVECQKVLDIHYGWMSSLFNFFHEDEFRVERPQSVVDAQSWNTSGERGEVWYELVNAAGINRGADAEVEVDDGE